MNDPLMKAALWYSLNKDTATPNDRAIMSYAYSCSMRSYFMEVEPDEPEPESPANPRLLRGIGNTSPYAKSFIVERK